MENIELVLDNLFGSEIKAATCDPHLGQIAVALSALNVDALFAFDEQGEALAQWTKTGSAVERVNHGLQNIIQIQEDVIELEIFTDKPGSVWFLAHSPKSELQEGSYLGGHLASQNSEQDLQAALLKQLPWLQASASIILTLSRKASQQNISESRLQQIMRQHAAFQEEHRRVVMMNLETAETRLKAQEIHAQHLEQAKLDAVMANQ